MTDNSSAGLQNAAGISADVQTFSEQDKELIGLETVLVLQGVS